MKEFKAFIKRVLCKHDYEYSSQFYLSKNKKMYLYEIYNCIKCNKRKEFKVK